MGSAALRERARIAHYRDFSDRRPDASSPKRRHIVRSTDNHSRRDRESRRNSPKFRCAVQRKTCGTEDTPGETARFTGFGQYHHRQAPDYRPAGRTVHRLGSRGRKINIGANDAAESWLVTRTLPIGIFETCPTRAENVR